jgi:hypothetical protein
MRLFTQLRPFNRPITEPMVAAATTTKRLLRLTTCEAWYSQRQVLPKHGDAESPMVALATIYVKGLYVLGGLVGEFKEPIYCNKRLLRFGEFGDAIAHDSQVLILRGDDMIRIKSSQKYFSEAEVASLTGIPREDLRSLAREKHLGTMASALVGGTRAESWLFTNSDLLILAVLPPNSGASNR